MKLNSRCCVHNKCVYLKMYVNPCVEMKTNIWIGKNVPNGRKWTVDFKLELMAVYNNSPDVALTAQWKEADFVQETCVTDTLLLDVNKNSQSVWQEKTINPVCPSALRVEIFPDGIKRVCHPIKFSIVYCKISYPRNALHQH